MQPRTLNRLQSWGETPKGVSAQESSVGPEGAQSIADGDGAKDAMPAIRRGIDGQLVVRSGGMQVPVRVWRCFPWSEPGRYVSLRDDRDDEVLLIRDLAELDPASCAVVESALREVSLVLEVIAVESVEEDFEMRCFRVLTRQGRRTFQTARDIWPRPEPDGSLLVEDVQGDIFRFPPREQLDARSQSQLWALLD